jgi:hypothetical protein
MTGHGVRRGGMETMAVLASAYLVIAMTSCNGKVGGQSKGGEPAGPVSSACSTGPEYAWNYPFATEAAPEGFQVERNDPPVCTPHCGFERLVGPIAVYPYEALPSGACTTQAELCSMRARPTCPCANDNRGSANGANTLYCKCESGMWRCSLIAGAESSAQPCTKSLPECGSPEAGTFDAASE